MASLSGIAGSVGRDAVTGEAVGVTFSAVGVSRAREAGETDVGDGSLAWVDAVGGAFSPTAPSLWRFEVLLNLRFQHPYTAATTRIKTPMTPRELLR